MLAFNIIFAWETILYMSFCIYQWKCPVQLWMVWCYNKQILSHGTGHTNFFLYFLMWCSVLCKKVFVKSKVTSHRVNLNEITQQTTTTKKTVVETNIVIILALFFRTCRFKCFQFFVYCMFLVCVCVFVWNMNDTRV